MVKAEKLSIFLVLFSLKLFSQTPELVFEKVAFEQGSFPQNISKICQDNLGFIWIASDNGLDRFDGYRFQNFRFSETDTNTISSNIVGSLFFDIQGEIWAGTVNGLNRLNLKTEQFSRYYHNSSNEHSIADNLISPIFEDKNKTLWIGTYGGLCRYNRGKNNFTTFKHLPSNPKSLSHNTVSYIYQDSKGEYWIGTWGGGLNKFDPKTGEFTHYLYDANNPKTISNNNVSFICEDKQGHYWVGTRGGGLCEFDPIRGEFSRLTNNSLSDNTLTSIFIDDTGKLWIGTWNGGLNIFDPKTKETTNFRYNPDDPNSLISDCINYIYRDHTGIIFLGTNKGINKVRAKKSTFDFYTYKPGKGNESINSKDVRSIFQDKIGNLWIGTHEGGLNKFDASTGRYSYYTFEYKGAPIKSKVEISGIIENSDGSFWLSSVGEGLYKFYPDGRFSHYDNYSNPSSLIAKDNVTFIFKDSKELLWLGFPNGIVSVVNPTTGDITTMKIDSTIETKALLNEINYIVEDKNQNKWIAVRHKGVYCIDSKTQKISHIQVSKDEQNSLSENDVFVLHISDNDILWIGTMNGLNRYDIKTGIFKHYFIENGLPDNSIRSIKEDDKGNLWIGTHNGLSRFNPITERFNNYDERDGVWIKQFNSNAFYSTTSKEMFLCGYNGFIRFNPDHIDVSSYIPIIHISDLEIHQQKVKINKKIAGKTVLNQSILFTEKIELSHSQNNFAIHFSSLHYKMTDKNQYAYKLDGYDKDWHYSGNVRVAKYMNLPSGTYTFKVKGSNADGIWNEKGDSIKIVVRPPWWRSWWMLIVYFVIIFISIIAYVNWRTIKHRRDNLALQRLVELRTEEIAAQNIQLSKQADELKEMSQLRSRFYTYLSHEFRTPLTMIMGPLQQVLSGMYAGNIVDLHKTMLRNSQRLLHLIDELLDLSKLEKGKMTIFVKQYAINPFINRIIDSFYSLTDQKKIKLVFAHDERNTKCYFDKEKLEKVLINLISNAIKYTPNSGEIVVTVCSHEKTEGEKLIDRYPEGFVEISVKDNGAGIDPERLPHIFEQFYQEKSSSSSQSKGWGIGLALVKELIELHKGEITVNSKKGEGTKFEIVLPLGISHFSNTETEQVVVSIDTTDDNQEYDSELSSLALNISDQNTNVYDEIDIQNPTTDKKQTILVVEDNLDIRKYIKQILVNEYHVIEAENGKEGFEKVYESKPDIIISDIMMPIMDGLELCRKIKTDVNTCHIPIVLITAKSSEVDKIEGLENKADDYLIKPFNPIELKKRIENLIELRQVLQRKYRQEVLMNPVSVEAKSLDERFLERVRNIIEKNISSPNLSVEMLYTEVGISRSNFHSKFKALTGQSANQFIRTFRLKRAIQLLEQNAGNISDVAYEVGFTSTAYFTKCFKEEFGMLPSDYHNPS